jgi:hypothetical protein
LQAGRAASWGWDIKSGRNLWFGDTHALLGTTPETHLESVEEFLDRVHPLDGRGIQQAAHRFHSEKEGRHVIVGPLRGTSRNFSAYATRTRS